MADSDEDFESGEETGEDTPTASQDRSKTGASVSLSGPRPLYHEREDVDWEDELEDVTPQTGTKIRLIHPPPSFLDVSKDDEALNPNNPLSIANPDEHNKIMGRAKDSEKTISKDAISMTGYPIGIGGTLVYDAMELNTQRRATVPAGTHPFYTLEGDSDTTLVFDSLFESANLYQAYRTGPFEYDLVLRNDFNTNGHTQWYYFRVSNTRPGEQYRFNIVNMYKKSSMYNRGLRPLMYSEQLAKSKGVGWYRGGTDIVYVKNNFHYQKRADSRNVLNYYSLSFSVTFPAARDTCFLAHCFPYTYSDLQQYIARLEGDPETRKILRRRLLCRSVAGNRCDVITITSGNTVEVDTQRDAAGLSRKPCVVVSARVHPGESNASWIAQGCVDFLVSSDPRAVALREQIVFKVIPMLNPDGVILGNYRTGLAGSDLNRKWKDPDQSMHPTVYFLKQMMEKMRDERGVAMFVDLHGHSVKNNAFLYGCDARYWQNAPNHPSRKAPSEYENRIFPAHLDQLCPQISLRDCRFHLRRKKEVSARAVCWRLITPCSYTLEASFGGADSSHSPPSTHFSTQHYRKIGQDLLVAMHDMLCQDAAKVEAMKAQLIRQLETDPIADDNADSDDEGGGESAAESDDDSDDDTVENLVLPQAVVQKLTAKPKSSGKAKGRRASVTKVKKEAKKEDLDRSDSQKNKSALEKPPPPPPKRDPPPKYKEPEPKRAPPEPEPPSQCTCPSCQVYEQFINGTIGGPGPGRGDSTGSGPGSPPLQAARSASGLQHGPDQVDSLRLSTGSAPGRGEHTGSLRGPAATVTGSVSHGERDSSLNWRDEGTASLPRQGSRPEFQVQTSDEAGPASVPNYHPAVVAQHLLRTVNSQPVGTGSLREGGPPSNMNSQGSGGLGAGGIGARWSGEVPTDNLNMKSSGAGPGGVRSPKRLGGASAGPMGGTSRLSRKF